MDALESSVDPLVLTLRFGAALGLGVLLGLERERIEAPRRASPACARFGLLALSGGVAAFIDESLGRPWLALAVFAADGGARGRVVRGHGGAR